MSKDSMSKGSMAKDTMSKDGIKGRHEEVTREVA